MSALDQFAPRSPLYRLASVITFFYYGPMRHGCQDRWGN